VSDWADEFKPVEHTGDHRWRINDGDTPTHGYGVICDRCRLELVPCVDLVGLAPQAVLYVAGVGGKYTPKTHGRCPGERAR
jgi:hypothetical protein